MKKEQVNQMFQEHDYSVWGSYCDKCGEPCSILQNGHHPWDKTAFSIKINCSACGHERVIRQSDAEAFYNKKILSYFSGLSGFVLDLGCGSGFLSRALIQNQQIDKLYGLDTDPACEKATAGLCHNRFKFVLADLRNLNQFFAPGSVDYLVSRDVFMFVEDTEQFFTDITSIVTTEIRQMGWFRRNNPRMRNRLEPRQIAHAYEERGWKTRIEYLDWYKSGYYICASK